MDDYLYRLSSAQIQFLAVDNTHTKYLKGSDKRAWNNFGSAYKAQVQYDNFIDSLNAPNLAAGEEFEIPVKKNNKTTRK